MTGYEEAYFEFEWQDEEEAKELKGYTDSSWAGCRKSRT